jgi:hypothetical protein
MEDVGIFYGHLVHFTVFCNRYFMDIWYGLCAFGIFFPFWYFVPRKIWQPCSRVLFEGLNPAGFGLIVYSIKIKIEQVQTWKCIIRAKM